MSKKNDSFREALESAKERSVGQLLLRAARLWNERAAKRIQETNPSIRMAHTLLLPHIDIDGTKLTDLASRAGISKQAAGELVDGLEREGLLERIADPRDRRAKLVRFTAAGRKSLLAGLGVLDEIEAEISTELGAQRTKVLGRTLLRLVEILERPGR